MEPRAVVQPAAPSPRGFQAMLRLAQVFFGRCAQREERPLAGRRGGRALARRPPRSMLHDEIIVLEVVRQALDLHLAEACFAQHLHGHLAPPAGT